MMSVQATELARALILPDDKRFRDDLPLNEDEKKAKKAKAEKILERAKRARFHRLALENPKTRA